MCPKLQRQTNRDPPGVYKSGIIGQPVLLFELPLLDTVGPLQKVGWRKFEYPWHPLPSPNNGFPT